MRRRLTAAALVLSAVLAGGCGSPAEETAVPSPDEDLIAALAEEAFRQLPPGATLKVTLNQPGVPCDRGPADTTFTEIEYLIEHPRGWPIEQVIPALAGYWTRTGYTVVRDDRDNRQMPALEVERPDGFRIAVSVLHPPHGRDAAYLVGSAICR